jgi:hypothetical protein
LNVKALTTKITYNTRDSRMNEKREGERERVFPTLWADDI